MTRKKYDKYLEHKMNKLQSTVELRFLSISQKSERKKILHQGANQ